MLYICDDFFGCFLFILSKPLRTLHKTLKALHHLLFFDGIYITFIKSNTRTSLMNWFSLS